MIKRSQIKRLILMFLLFPLMGYGQGLDHIQGEILVRINHQSQLSKFLVSIQDKYPNQFSSSSLDEVSSSFNIWSLNFDHNQINEISFLSEIRSNPHIEAAQLNYFTENRSEPNDPLFSNQWHFKNIGQNGGTPGIDLDAPLAWDTSTGGLTFLGDTIVICIIDESFDYFHEDLNDNIWINHAEIPNDNIDNDGNGYVDDYYGWNVNSNEDDIGNTGPNDWHGTAVTGIAGAVGDNNIGISGLCWNVKLMLVSRGSTVEDAIEAYTYPYLNRKMFNETEGDTGAYVVSTNASWGINFGTPDDAPLWCAIYDSLGSVGVLNTAATINSDVDVEVVGDLPTTCTSDYLITTTGIDNHDNKMTNAGYGLESIDLGAFGFNILSTSNDDSYSIINGTSAAAPQLSATIGLLHTAPCPDFATLAKFDPAVAALQLKDYILEGVDPNSSLEGITVTGGRLNVNNSLQILMDNCNFSGCFSPFSIQVDPLTISSNNVSWQSANSTLSVNFQYRESGAIPWITINSAQSPLVIQDLLSCTSYEYRFRSFCSNGSDIFSEIFTFESDGCCYPPDEFIVESNANSISLEWNPITASVGYLLLYRQVGSSIWNDNIVVSNNFTLSGLMECQEYEFAIQTLCANSVSSSSSVYTFSTKGCDACHEFEYCESYGPSQTLTWINQVTVADLDHYSGASNDGYSDFTEYSANLIQGFIHEIDITTDFDFYQFPSYFNVWIDLNQNGVFGENELLLQSSDLDIGASGILFIPPDALLGSTRMRISNHDEILGPCGIWNAVGEVEDYCVFISEPTECLPPVNFNANIIDNAAHLTWSGNLLIDEVYLNYKEIGSNEWTTILCTSNGFVINNLNPCTDYEYYLASGCMGETSMPSSIQYFTSLGCGTCLDNDYCGAVNCEIDFEWIERVSFNDFENNSGPNDGYITFSDFNTNLERGEDYSIELMPGFSNDTFEEYFSVWIDFNQDGAFNNSNERVLDGYTFNGEMVTGNIAIPLDAATGSTRMRVSMKHDGFALDPCENEFEGEIEEYCINVVESDNEVCPTAGLESFLPLDFWNLEISLIPISDVVSYKVRYRPLDSLNLPWVFVSSTNINIMLSELDSCIEYDLQIQSICELGLSNFSDSYIVSTCGLVSTSEIQEEQIDKVSIYPNPFSTKANLSLNLESPSTISVVVYSSIGQVIDQYEFEASSGENVFDFNFDQTVASGVYFFNVFKNETPLATERVLYQAP